MKSINKRFRKSETSNKKFEGVVISSEYYEDDRPSYICSICNQGPLIRLTDAGMNNSTFWCRNCSVEYNPEEEVIRRESKLSVPEPRNQETLISNTPGIPDISIHHEPEIKGGLLELKRKGLKITEYKEDIPRSKRK